ncbi:MAG: phosphoglycerate dehydrogenase [Deltaproteobacteria bacterium]|nr:phosphoglycerate dehydrogenase [Deltaproteobacteria bacterium]
MKKVLVSDTLSEHGLAVLRAASDLQVDYRPGLSEEDLANAIEPYEALVIRSGSKVTAKVLGRARNLEVVGRAGIGVDNVDVKEASRRGVVVMNTPTGNAVTTAEHALTLLLSLARKIPQATASIKAGKWEKSKFEGHEVTGKTLGVIGLGNIGRIVANRALGLKMTVLGHDPVLSADRAAQLGFELVTLDELFRRSDFITVHTPLTEQTRGLIDARAIDRMKPGVLLVNAARGGIIDEEALRAALESGKVGGAALDVFVKEPPPKDQPLLQMDRVIATPHLGASTEEAQERVAVEIAEQIVTFLTEGGIKNAVNIPSLSPSVLPYVDLGRRLGTVLAQLDRSDVSEIRVEVAGDAAEHGVTPIANEAVAGFLAHFLDIPVNLVSAPHVAGEQGIRVLEIKSPRQGGYSALVRVEVAGTGGSRVAAGTVMANRPRIVSLIGFEVDADPTGSVLVMRNDDVPGVIGAVGTVLGGRGINVSRAQVGTGPRKGEAMSFWNLDSPVDDATLALLRALPHVSAVLPVSFSQ